MDREISPPPPKRQRLTRDTAVDMALKNNKRHSVVFSWNVNGIKSFLPPTTAPITTFFKPVAHQSLQTAGRTEHVPFTNPLRTFLRRHDWPEVLFLQEVKISPSGQKTPAILRSTVNTSLGGQDTPNSQTKYTIDLNLRRDKFNARGFGGKVHGVATLVREDFASRHVSCIRHADWDLEGRATIVELCLGHSDPTTALCTQVLPPGPSPLALINVYAVNGTTNPY